MATAFPLSLPDDDLDVAPLGSLAHLPPEIRAAIEGAEQRLAAGTAQLVAHADVPRALEEIRQTRRG
jgi:hypothetical protein